MNTPPASDCAADTLEPDGEWNAYLQAMSGFLGGNERAVARWGPPVAVGGGNIIGEVVGDRDALQTGARDEP
jgi:hypothetical protein